MFRYITGVVQEFKYIRWLSVRRALALAAVAILVGVVSGFALGALDSVFASLLRSVVL